MKRRIKKAVIPAAGYGTRFLPLTKVVPKELLPVGTKPAIHYVVEEAVAAGVEEVILICHSSKLPIIDYFKPNRDLREFLETRGKKKETEELDRIESLCRFQVVYQDEPLGLGHAIGCAREAVGDESFLVMLPDVLVVGDVPAARQLVEACCEDDGWGVLLEEVSVDRVSSYGIIEGEKMTKGCFRLKGAVEKPTREKAPSNLAILGRYLFRPEIFDLLSKVKAGSLGEIQLTDAIDAEAKRTVGKGILLKGKIFDIGVPEGLSKAYQYFV